MARQQSARKPASKRLPRDRASVEGPTKAIKGGTYLCHDSGCNHYRVAARTFNEPHTLTAHMGFRLAWSAVA
ncbi:SUMF1/EgtB/PvdO family nonheme iron enzyme [Paracoccus sp. (in: a-proteobacteria)]|uniref:SUMF1/EgtB/PvdO family nonheme iron enzyme n=1 Tax=Paracoccus sp. TaxID=267 RepID=UPI00391C2017